MNLPHDLHIATIGAVATAWRDAAADAPQTETLGIPTPITPKFVADIGLAVGLRSFVFLKRPGEAVNSIVELHWGPPITTTFLTHVPIADFKDGGGCLAIDPKTGELCVADTCSPNPATGGDAVAVVWRTGIIAGWPVATIGGVDQATLNRITALEQKLALMAQALKGGAL
jgi:hypothetical protein